jgi:hypothetical protein
MRSFKKDSLSWFDEGWRFICAHFEHIFDAYRREIQRLKHTSLHVLMMIFERYNSLMRESHQVSIAGPIIDLAPLSPSSIHSCFAVTAQSSPSLQKSGSKAR